MNSTTKKRILIIGAGGHGKELCSYIGDFSPAESVVLAGFIDENKAPGQKHSAGVVLGDFAYLERLLKKERKTVFRYITAAGDNALRRRFVEAAEQLKAPSLAAWTLRHPFAQVGLDVEIGEGTCLAPGSIVTTRVRIGRHCILNVNASISHDCVIGDFTNINPGAVICGNVRIGENCYIGASATVIDEISIGPGTIIGAGAVVIRDLPANVTAVGVPARIIKRR